jgi:hypothetical protein
VGSLRSLGHEFKRRISSVSGWLQREVLRLVKQELVSP